MPNTRLILVLCALAGTAAAGCASMGLPSPSMPSFSADANQVGTKAWWKKHKKKATFVPGSGYQVAGTDGYFDGDGRPINSRVARRIDQEKENTSLLGDVKFQETVAGVKEKIGLGPNEQLAQAAYARGEALFREKKYNDAAKEFNEAISRAPDTALEQDAMFQRAECYFFATKYPKAVNAYEELIKKYPNSPHLDKTITRQFSIARYWDEYDKFDHDWPLTPNMIDNKRPLFDTVGRAVKTYENIRLNDPTGPLADDAVMAMANNYFLRGRYNDADYHYDLLRKEYPRSTHQFEAHLLGLQCKLRRYQGPDYDSAPLDEAKTLVAQLRSQFNNKLNDDQRTRLAEVQSQLTKQLALREYGMAEYYDNIKHYGPAKRYYLDVLNKYPESELAGKAKDRLLALGEQPDKPTPPLEAIVNLFPENDEMRKLNNIPMIDEGVQQIASPPQEGSNGTIRR
ncbi:MAG: outer membrane protein assembly factor BamD [Pirellulales bacterium]|nr:outer membrane protein assembly factor BamD [Pirellulales bacterium]MBX3434431.1 outer membrane protein assembly factor BamD [Pirellulales bacterium]